MYLVPIRSALIAFPLIALMFTLPYVVTQYKKFGAIPFWRTVILYSFILYLINMYFFVILPLPPVEEVAEYTGPTMQLVPFQFVSDFIKKSSFTLSDPGTYLAALTHSSFFVVLFNILLFVPLGIYLRYYFKWGWKKTLAASLGISLFFELTQLSGLYGIYPRAYRLFDVDDLMLNTLGGMTGYWITPLICWFLPSRERIDELAYEKGERVPLLRRFLALVLDWITISVGMGALSFFLHLSAAGAVFVNGTARTLFLFLFYFAGLPLITGGYTFGKWFFRMKLIDENGGKPRLVQYLIRYGLLYGTVFCGPGLVLGVILLSSSVPALFMILLALFVVFIGGVWLLFLWESLAQLFGRSRDYYYGRLSRTRNKNMIVRRAAQEGGAEETSEPNEQKEQNELKEQDELKEQKERDERGERDAGMKEAAAWPEGMGTVGNQSERRKPAQGQPEDRDEENAEGAAGPRSFAQAGKTERREGKESDGIRHDHPSSEEV